MLKLPRHRTDDEGEPYRIGGGDTENPNDFDLFAGIHTTAGGIRLTIAIDRDDTHYGPEDEREPTPEKVSSLVLAGTFTNVENARNFFLASGIGLFLVWLTTNYKAAERPVQGMGIRRRVHV